MNYTIVEEASYTEELESIANARRMDDALASIMWGLATNPHKFDPIERMPGIYIAKTKRFNHPDGMIPPLSVLFEIDLIEHRVHLLAIRVNLLDDDGM